MAYTIISYSPERVAEHKNVKIADAAKIGDSVVWVDIENPSEQEMDELEKAYKLHHLAIDDCMHDVQRPKIEAYDDYFFVVLRHIEYSNEVRTKQISIFVGKNYLISVHKEKLKFLDELRGYIREGGHRVNRYKSDYLLYKITDRIVDNYFVVLESIEDCIEIIEDEVLKNPTKRILERIFKIKKDLLLIRKPIWPLREVMHTAQSGSIETISEDSLLYFRDIYDHLINIIDLIETYRELVTAALEIYLSSVSNSLNEVIKVLTVIAAILMFPTLIASVYGMNFKNMPELDWTYGYPFALFLIVLSMVLTYVYFKRKKWV